MTTEILYRQYLLGRLGAGKPLELSLDELAARALGEHGQDRPILSAAQVAAEVAALVPAAEEVVVFSAKPAAPSTSAKARRISERVSEMLVRLGVDESALTAARHRSAKYDSLSVAARRALIGKLKTEGLSAAGIAAELGLEISTVYGHLRHLRAGK